MAAIRSFRWKQLRVTLLVLVGLALLVFGVLQVGRVFDVFAKRYTLITHVGDVAGLREGAPVTLAGQRVGQVSSIEFIPLERKPAGAHLEVRLAISEDVRQQIRRDSRVYIRPQGLLGDKYIDVSPGTATAVVLQPGDTLVAEPAMDIEQLLARSASMLDSATLAVSDLRKVTGGLIAGEGTIGRLLKDEQLYTQMIVTTGTLQRTLAQLNDPNGSFGRLVHDPRLYNRLISAISRVDSIGALVLGGEGTVGKLLADDALYQSLFSTAARADSAVANLSGVLNRMTTGTGTFQKLATDPQLYDSLLKAVVDLQTLLADVRANPKKFVPPVQIRVF